MCSTNVLVKKMPKCGCFHELDLIPAPEGSGVYELSIEMEGITSLKSILENAGIAESVSVRSGWFQETYVLEGVTDPGQVTDFVKLLQSTIIVQIEGLQECYSLSPYTVFDEDGYPRRSLIGNVLNRAKYWQDKSLIPKLGDFMWEFISRHPRLRTALTITAPPKSDSSTPDIARSLAEHIAEKSDLALVRSEKALETEPQKNLPEGIDEEDAVARALHEAGARGVFGLSIAKDARFTLGGIDLSEERWK